MNALLRWWRWYVWPESLQTYEITQPWVVYRYIVPDWLTRITGQTRIGAECCICGVETVLRLRIPRWGPVVDRGPHPARVAFLAAHLHRLQASAPETWVRPLRNPDAHGDTLDILVDVAERARRAPPEGSAP
jgi:hypothetical protein